MNRIFTLQHLYLYDKYSLKFYFGYVCLFAYTLFLEVFVQSLLYLFSVNGLGSISGSPGPPNQSMDLLAAMGLSSNESWPGISLVPGYLKGKPAYLLQGRVQKLY